MSFTLYKQMLKVNVRSMLSYALGSAFYMLLMVWVYPSITENNASLNDLVKTMPAGLSKAFGLETGFGSFEGYISGEFYGVLLTLILTIFCVLLPTQLLAKLVDRGSMAYLLASPVTRGKVAATQAMVFVTGISLIMLVTTAAGFIGSALFLDESASLHGGTFVWLNAGALCLFFAIGAISFFVSAVMNDEKRALGVSGSIAFGFFSLDLLAKMSEKLSWLKYLTMYTFYQPSRIVADEANIAGACAVLALLGLAVFWAGIFAFKKRDLPL